MTDNLETVYKLVTRQWVLLEDEIYVFPKKNKKLSLNAFIIGDFIDDDGMGSFKVVDTKPVKLHTAYVRQFASGKFYDFANNAYTEVPLEEVEKYVNNG